MSKARLLVNCLALTVLTLGISSIANAQATRTWVSGVGDDANPCSRTAPCKTFAGAISKTAPSGEISVLDPGGFGAVNITKALTINGDGTLAAILNSGVTGIIVNAGANDVVYIRNISINGAGTGLNGIRYIAGKALHVENCNIYGQGNNTAGNGNGIIVALTATAGNVFVKDTNIKTCAVTGISVATTTGFVAGVLDNVRLEGLPTGAVIGNNAFVSIRNSLINLCTSTGVSITGSGTPQTVQAITRDDILAAHDAWIRPDNVKIFVVGDTNLAEIVPLLEARFGHWQAPATPRGTKAFSAAIPEARPRIILIDRPQSPQSLILAGEVTSVTGTDDLVAMGEANDVLGGSFLSRLNMELRENKHWAYGAFGVLNRVEHQVPYLVFAPVQADRTGDSIAAARAQLQQFLGPNGVTAAELERTINGSIRELPGSFETSQAVLGALQQNDLYRRPDDYYGTLASRLRRLTVADLDAAARRTLDPSKFVWVVVGDASRVRSQLEPLGLPVEVVPAAH